MNQLNTHIEKYWGYLALLAWIGIAVGLQLVRQSPFAIDEEAARGLLLTWTVADNVVNPIVMFGLPDFRALLYLPVGTYWSGNLLAIKILSLIIAFIAVTMLYKWCRRTSEHETAIIASALILISPIMISQVDSLSAGPFILLGFTLGVWLDNAYRNNEKYFGGWYFTQMLWVAILTTLHPIALAYPLAIAWRWLRQPHEFKKSTHIYVGLAIAVILSLLIRMGWNNVALFENPVEVLATALQGSIVWSAADIKWIPGIIAGLVLTILLVADFKNLSKDLLSQMLLVSILLGIVMPDESWALLCMVLIIYRGTHYLIKFNQSRNKTSLIGQRGIVAIVFLFVSLFFMLEDKNHSLTIRHAILAPEDELIQSLAAEATNDSAPFRAASQWPGRSMLATKRDVLPLPPEIDDPEHMLAAVQSLTHIAFNPFDPEYKPLSNAISGLGGATETLGLFKAGVILKVREHNVEMTTHQRLAQEDANKAKEQATETTDSDQ